MVQFRKMFLSWITAIVSILIGLMITSFMFYGELSFIPFNNDMEFSIFHLIFTILIYVYTIDFLFPILEEQQQRGY